MCRNKFTLLSVVAMIALLMAGLFSEVAAKPLAATAPDLGAVESFAVLGASAVENVGFSILNGDLGISPGEGSSVTGFPDGLYTGTLHAADGVALQAQNDATTAVNSLDSQPCTANLTGQDLGGLTLIPGVYCFDSSAQLTGNLVLDGEGDPNAVWIFRMESTLTIASASSITTINTNAQPVCNVYWQVGSSATFGTTTEFVGNVFASESITMTTNANLAGRLIAQTAAVTLDDNTITPVVCAVVPADSPTATAILPGLPDTGGAPIRPDPLSWGLLLIGGVTITALVFGVSAFRRSDRQKK